MAVQATTRTVSFTASLSPGFFHMTAIVDYWRDDLGSTSITINEELPIPTSSADITALIISRAISDVSEFYPVTAPDILIPEFTSGQEMEEEVV